MTHGAPFTVTVQDAAVRAALTRLTSRVTHPRPALEDIGRALVNLTEDSFQAHASPWGEPWPKLSKRYERRMAKRGRATTRTLQRTGGLAASLHHTASDTQVTVGVSKVYAAIHQFGGTPDMPPGPRAVPAAPYLPIRRTGALAPVARAVIERVIGVYLQPDAR